MLIYSLYTAKIVVTIIFQCKQNTLHSWEHLLLLTTICFIVSGKGHQKKSSFFQLGSCSSGNGMYYFTRINFSFCTFKLLPQVFFLHCSGNAPSSLLTETWTLFAVLCKESRKVIKFIVNANSFHLHTTTTH